MDSRSTSMALRHFLPSAICLFFMMYPIMVKIDFAEVIKAVAAGSPLADVSSTGRQPFTM